MPKFWGSIKKTCSIFSRSDSENTFVQNSKYWQSPKSESVERVNAGILKSLEQKLRILVKHQFASFSLIFDIILRICCKLRFLRWQHLCGLFPHIINDQHFETCLHMQMVSFFKTQSFKTNAIHVWSCDNCQRRKNFTSILFVKCRVDLFLFSLPSPKKKQIFTFSTEAYARIIWNSNDANQFKQVQTILMTVSEEHA